MEACVQGANTLFGEEGLQRVGVYRRRRRHPLEEREEGVVSVERPRGSGLRVREEVGGGGAPLYRFRLV